MENSSYPVMLTLMVPRESKSYRHIYFTCFLFLYLLILSINIRLISVIIMEKSLHEPMFMFLCNLCVNVIYGASGFYPIFLFNLLLDSYVISSHLCALQSFVIYSSLITEITILTVMAYDRYVAICRPLDYHSKLTKNKCLKLILLSWIIPNCYTVPAALLSSLRILCKYHIDKLYCDNWSIVNLSCASSFVNNIFGYFIIVTCLSFVVVIIVSYIKLIAACKASLENRKNFWQTCLPHLLLLMNFVFSVLFDVMYSRYGANDIPESVRNFLALELIIVPPVVNPLIYGLNIKAVRKRAFPSCPVSKIHVSEAQKMCKT
ncbi:olfactory receptor 49-like [Triplophysa rosa]|uniref:Olfactory receptor n=1 Tax=Triplophysa rosa TaxID=992332 RepID=A0A9W7TEY4_TRIRA|nr:olfactory receptor 49-like [Triplophysa rosa]KAI7795965.1 odorant receptor [Triplophysa rosa]